MKNRTPSPRGITFLLLGLSLVLVVLFLSMPFVRFSSSLYTKRSANTFVGDEKYQTARAETEDVLSALEEQGMMGTIQEEVIERVNSKGATTSLIIFTITAENTRSGWDVLRSGLSAGTWLKGILAAFLLAWGTSLACLFSSGKRADWMGKIGFTCALAAFFLVPVIFLSLNRSLSRTVDLYLAGESVRGIENLLPALDAFLYDGTGGDQLDSLLGALNYSVRPALFLLLLPGFMTICASVLAARRSLKQKLIRVLLYTSVLLFSVFILYPFFVMFITAFRSNAETTDMRFTHILPVSWMFSNLQDTLNRGVLRYLLNSLAIAGGATAVAMLCGIPAAYAMARMEFRGKRAYLGFVIMSQMFSPVVLLVGISRLMNTLYLNDTLAGLMLINAAFNQAFAIWLLRGTFVSISSEMEQAACIDGCSVLGALIRILLPMAAPGVVTTLIFVFINAWNEYTISTVLISTQTNRPITVGITQFSSFNMIEWQYLFAAALLATVPVVILFMLIEKHLAAGLTAGGVKG